ncbi:MAG: hypothetical protein O3B01_21355 [Planctomycetota bacterium]|nr:hypothetical protein [Planctomycetota bacterium]
MTSSERSLLNRLVFLIHPFCYAGVKRDEPAWQFARREQKCAEFWLNEARELGNDAALVLIPSRINGHPLTEKFVEDLDAAIGSRCIPLRCPYPSTPGFWDIVAQETEEVVGDLRGAFLTQQESWSREELSTGLHCRGCVAMLVGELKSRNLALEPGTLIAEAWGESFDGCVTKYSLNIRRLLGLANVIEIDFQRSVPDASFLLEAELVGRFELGADLRLFQFIIGGGKPAALFVRTSESPGDPAMRVHVPIDPGRVSVTTKQCGRLWPLPVEDRTPWPKTGPRESPQELVQSADGGMIVPVSSGMVYRLAKAPAYIMAEDGMPEDEFFGQLRQAVLLA